MNKLYAEFTIYNADNAAQLIRAFFREFNHESLISIKGKKGIVKIAFDTPPLETISALGRCQLDEFSYPSDEGKEQEIVAESKEKTDDSTTVSSKEEPIKKGRGRNRWLCEEPIQIPELNEIANKAKSFEEFADLVSDFLRMGNRKESFKALIYAAIEVNTFSWNDLVAELNNKETKFAQWERNQCSQKVKEKFGDSQITLMSFLYAIRQYKDRFSNDETVTKSKEGTQNIQMPCMSEVNGFEQILRNLDNVEPSEKLNYVLRQMGLDEEEPANKEMIVKYANNIIAGFEVEDIKAQVIFGKFLCDYARRNNGRSMVKADIFLNELKKFLVGNA